MHNDSTNKATHSNESFRFAQISDPHLSSPGIPFPWELTNKRLLGYLSWLRKRRRVYQRWVLDLALEKIHASGVAHTVVTGDLTHIGLNKEFEQVVQWLKQAGNAQNVTVIPGNHDLYVNERWNRSFAHWRSYLIGDSTFNTEIEHADQAQHWLEQTYPVVRIRNNIAFIGMSSVFAAPWFRATGFINVSQLERLQKVLQHQQLKSCCKILLIHHPISTRTTATRKSLLNYQHLVDILQKYPVQLVLHGHGHQSSMETIRSANDIDIPVIGAASTSSIDQTPARRAEFLLFDVSPSRSGWQISVHRHNLDLLRKQFINTFSDVLNIPAIA